MEISEAIKSALNVFREYKTTPDLETIGLVLPKTGMSREMAWHIIDFMPLAFGRAFMKDACRGFSDEYERCSYKNGQAVDKVIKKLTDEPVFLEAKRIALEMIEGGKVNDPGFQAVLERSVELNAIKHLVSKGSKPENIVLSSPYLLRRENL
ncbi:MAG TPA: hypothetical protein VGO50_16095 [Pyrinomonadaceae bacterium]|jgi:hypothetical protein|nr:hypothetical protein [Pyrinomonadaceae bacterium]